MSRKIQIFLTFFEYFLLISKFSFIISHYYVLLVNKKVGAAEATPQIYISSAYLISEIILCLV